MGDSRGHGARPQEVLVTSTRTTHDLPTWQRWHRLRGHEARGCDPGPRGRGDEDSVARCGMLRKRERERAPWDWRSGLESHLYSQPRAHPALGPHRPAGPTATGGALFPRQTPLASHPVDAASLPGDTASEAPAHPDLGAGGQLSTLQGTEAMPRQGAALGAPQLQPA